MAGLSVPLVLLPGADGSAALRQAMVEVLSDTVTCKIIEPPPKAIKNYGELVDFYGAQLPKTGIVLLAESFSGPAAIKLAVRFPDRVKALVLASTFTQLGVQRHAVRIGSWLPLRMMPTAVIGWATGVRSLEGPQLRTIVDQARAVPQAVLKSRLLSLVDLEPVPGDLEIQVPCLWLHGRHDRLCPIALARRQADLIPGVQFCELDAGHFALQERPQEAAQAIMRFLAGC